MSCHFCKKHIHEKCAREAIGEELADKAFLKKNVFNCQSCLEMETPKIIENNTDDKMAEISFAIEHLLESTSANVFEPNNDDENGEGSTSAVELEELAEVEPTNIAEKEQEKEAHKVNKEKKDKAQTNKPCCVWSKCVNCDRLEEEKNYAISMRICHEKETATLKQKLEKTRSRGN